MKLEVKDFLIGYGNSHRPVTRDTVARWIKDELPPSGVCIQSK